jgi:hypothetical protein
LDSAGDINFALIPRYGVLPGVGGHTVAVSVAVAAQRFYGREAELAQALRAWVEKVNAWFAAQG